MPDYWFLSAVFLAGMVALLPQSRIATLFSRTYGPLLKRFSYLRSFSSEKFLTAAAMFSALVLLVVATAQATSRGILWDMLPGLLSCTIGLVIVVNHRQLAEFLYDDVTPRLRVIALLVGSSFFLIGIYALALRTSQ